MKFTPFFQNTGIIIAPQKSFVNEKLRQCLRQAYYGIRRYLQSVTSVLSLFIAVQFWFQKGLDLASPPSYNHHTAEGKMLPGSLLNRGVVGFDHIVDHSWLRSIRKQWRQEFQRVSFPEWKVPKKSRDC